MPVVSILSSYFIVTGKRIVAHDHTLHIVSC